MVFAQRLVWCAMNNLLVKPRRNFPRDGHRTAVIGTDLIVKVTKWQRWSGVVAALLVNKPPIREAYTVTFVEQFFSLLLWVEGRKVIESSSTRNQMHKATCEQKTRKSKNNISSNWLSQMQPDNRKQCNLAHFNTLSRSRGSHR